MPIYKKINGSYERISPLYIKDDSGNYFNPLGGVYVKQGGSYHLVYPTGIPLFMMGVCDESTPYLTKSTRDADSKYWENILLPKMNHELPTRMFSPNHYELSRLWPDYYPENMPTYVTFQKTTDSTVGEDMESWLNSMISEYGKKTPATLYIYVDNSGSVRWSHVETSILDFLNNLGVTKDSGGFDRDEKSYWSGNGWNVVLEQKSERWLSYFNTAADDYLTGNL